MKRRVEEAKEDHEQEISIEEKQRGGSRRKGRRNSKGKGRTLMEK